MRSTVTATLGLMALLGCETSSSPVADVVQVTTKVPDFDVRLPDAPGPLADTDTPATGVVGTACTGDESCAGGVCLDLPSGYCSQPCGEDTPCPEGSSCWGLGDAGGFCLQDCTSRDQCRGDDGYTCDLDRTCWLVDRPQSPVGGPCQADNDCRDEGAFCYPDTYQGYPTGFFSGYCMIADCSAESCPQGSTCEAIFIDDGTACVAACTTSCPAGYECTDEGYCLPGCARSGCPNGFVCDLAGDFCKATCSPDSCADGEICRADGRCGPPPCQDTGCGQGYECAQSGDCVPDLVGGPGDDPGTACPDLPERDCQGDEAYCGELVAFSPRTGPGYLDYPVHDETEADQYRSFARRDLQMLVQWAAAVVECKAKTWGGGNGAPLGLGDMSEADGSAPGSRHHRPDHPEGTHLDGFDIEIAYFQTSAAIDNTLRAVCPHTQAGQDVYRCVFAPTTLDLWRTSLFVGLLFTSPRIRVVGVDGQIGPRLEQATTVLCARGWLSGPSCSGNRPLAYETADEGFGWFQNHHDHLHLSLKSPVNNAD